MEKTTFDTFADLRSELSNFATSYTRMVDYPADILDEIAGEVAREAWLGDLSIDDALGVLEARLEAEAAARGIGVADPS